MSGVFWHTRDHGEVRLQGAERAYAGGLCADIAVAVLAPKIERRERLARILKPEVVADLDQAAQRWGAPNPDVYWADSAERMLNSSFGDTVVRTGLRDWTPVGELHLNTAIVVGADPVKLLAWMHGLCESHGYFLPAQHEWLWQTIRAGLDTHILREGFQWPEVLDLIKRVDAEGPIVWSYSVCESFPNPYIGDNPPPDEDAAEAWYDLSSERQWDSTIEKLLAGAWPPAVGERLDQCFLNAKTAFDAQAIMWQQRLDEIEREAAQTRTNV